MNWPVLIIFFIAAVTLITFLIMRNQKDEKELEHEIKEDYHMPRDESGDTEIDKVTR